MNKGDTLEIRKLLYEFPFSRVTPLFPYETYGQPHVYEPDFLVKLSNGTTLILEIKGQLHIDVESKHQAAKRWVSAVNNWRKLGKWDFPVCRNPQELGEMFQSCVAFAFI